VSSESEVGGMHGKYNLSDTESEIMEYLWQRGTPITTRELEDHFNTVYGKNWKRTTLNTHLSRLLLKDAVKRNKNVIEAYPRELFEQKQSRELLEQMYGGKLSNLFVALTGGKGITKEDEDEINDIIDRMQKR